MNETRYENYYDLLRKRRNEIMLTLAHVQKEQRAVDENKDWIDRAAYESRVHLLDNTWPNGTSTRGGASTKP